MKKLLSAALVIVMSLTLVFAPASYAAEETVTMGEANIKGLLNVLVSSMPEDAAQRVEIFENFRDIYVPNDDNIGSLISIVKDLENYEGEDFIGQVLNNLDTEALVPYKDEMVFVLCVLKALPSEHREIAVEDFETNRGVPVSSNESFQEALATIYSELVTAPDCLEEVHSIDDDAILRLAGAFKDNVMFTNGESKAFALYSADSTFKANLAEAINEHFSEINGTAITASNAANVALDAIVDVLNGFTDLKSELKTVLGNSAVGLYKTTSSSTEEDDKKDNAYQGSIFIPTGSIDPSTPTIPPAAPVDPHTYSDTANHWSNPYVTSLSKRGIFNGYEDGSFRPEKQITREEIAVAMMRALGLEEAAANAPKTNFADSASISLWARDAVNLMVELGIFTGYDDNSFKPGQVITREELTAVLIRKIGVADADDHGFIDAEHIGDWAEQYVKHAVELGLVNGYPDGTFKPANPVTRGETAKMLYGFMNHIG